MSDNPLNLALRFILELAILAALAYWGWNAHSGWQRWVLAIATPLLAAAAWAVFRVPGDGSEPIVQVSGWLRSALEAVLFVGAFLALYRTGLPRLALLFAAVSAAHYLLSSDRVARLVQG